MIIGKLPPWHRHPKRRLFHNQECYIVTYYAGTCGTLISALIYYLLFEKTKPLSNLNSRTAHSYLDLIASTWSLQSRELYYNTDKQDFFIPTFNQWQVGEPHENVIIFVDHNRIFNYNDLSNVYPNFTEFVITVKSKDKPQLELNRKIKLQNELNIKPSTIATDFFGFFEEEHNSKWIEKNASKYKDRIHSIDFMSIMTQPNAILNKLSTILNVSVNSNAELVYRQWLNKQVFLDADMGK